MGLSIHVLWPSGQQGLPQSNLCGSGAVGHNPTRHSGQSIRNIRNYSWQSLFPCAIGVANPVFDLVLDEVPYARTAIAVNAFAVNSLIGFIVCPLGQKDNAETISAVLDDIVVAGAVVGVVHGFDSSWAFSVIGSHRCWCGCQIIRPTLTYSVLAPIFFVAIKKYY